MKSIKITKANKKEVMQGKAGVLRIIHRGETLKEFNTEDGYRLYCTLKSLSKRKTGTYSTLPQTFGAEFSARKLKKA